METPGRTITTGSPAQPARGVSFSPIPSQRRQPPATQKGTSAPSFAPISANAIRESCCPVILFNPRRTAAASEEPPPIPASDGICFTSSMWTPPENPVSLKNNSAASHIRFAFPPGASPSLMEREIPPASVSVTSSQRDILCITLSIS